MEDRMSFILYKDSWEYVKKLPDEDAGQVLKAIFAFENDEELPEMSALADVAFTSIRIYLERDSAKFERLRAKRVEAGQKGGIQKEANASKSKQDLAKSSKSKQTLANEKQDLAKSSKSKQTLANEKQDLAKSSKSKQNDFFDKQNLANASKTLSSDSVSDSDSDSDSVSVSVSESESESERYIGSPNGDMPSETAPQSVREIVDMYHNICVSYPKVRTISADRERAVKARLRTHTINEFREVFERAEGSDFLRGANDRNWSATFDWMMSDKNFAKILDGFYDQRTRAAPVKKPNPLGDLDPPDWSNWGS